MQKSDFIVAVAKKVDLTSKTTVGEGVNAILESIGNALIAGENVTLAGIGTFKIVERAARIGRNPRTGTPINIPPKKAVKFTASKFLKEAL